MIVLFKAGRQENLIMRTKEIISLRDQLTVIMGFLEAVETATLKMSPRY
jgi:hypothetical protein